MSPWISKYLLYHSALLSFWNNSIRLWNPHLLSSPIDYLFVVCYHSFQILLLLLLVGLDSIQNQHVDLSSYAWLPLWEVHVYIWVLSKLS